MSQGDKSKYTDKQKRKADHIADRLRRARQERRRGQKHRVGNGQQRRWRRQSEAVRAAKNRMIREG